MNKQRRQRLNNLYNEMEMISSTLEDEDFVEKDRVDDVLSELDTKRQKKVFKMFNNDTQIFITCTSIEGISKDLLNNSNIIVVGKE